MESIEYGEAAIEVLDILKHTRKSDVEKISKEFIDFLKEISSETYKPELDHTKPIKEMGLQQKTQDILGIIYFKYWANEQEKKEFIAKLNKNEKKYQEEINRKYNVDVFATKTKHVEEVQIAVIQKENFIQKIINKIKNIFRR